MMSSSARTRNITRFCLQENTNSSRRELLQFMNGACIALCYPNTFLTRALRGTPSPLVEPRPVSMRHRLASLAPTDYREYLEAITIYGHPSLG